MLFTFVGHVLHAYSILLMRPLVLRLVKTRDFGVCEGVICPNSVEKTIKKMGDGASF